MTSTSMPSVGYSTSSQASLSALVEATVGVSVVWVGDIVREGFEDACELVVMTDLVFIGV